MSDTTSKLNIQLTSTGDLAAFTQAKEQAEALRSSVEGVRSTLETIGVGLSIGGLMEFGRSLQEFGANIAHMSEEAGISTRAFQVLSLVAQDAGVSQEQLSGMLNKLRASLGQAAEGGTKQAQAIHDLGLNTAELLSQPVEKQLEAIAKGYYNAADRGQAYAAVVGLLGKQSASMLHVFDELNTKGIAGLMAENTLGVASEATIKSTEHIDTLWGRIWTTVKAISATMLASASKPGMDPLNAIAGVSSESPVFAPEKKAAAAAESDGPPKKTQAEIQKTIDDYIANSPQMINAHSLLTEALSNESQAYEDLATKAARLNAEAVADEAKAKAMAAERTGDLTSQVAAVTLLTKASMLRGQANIASEQWSKQTADNVQKEAEIQQKLSEIGAKNGSLDEQRQQASDHLFATEQKLAELDPKSITYAADHLKLEQQELQIKGQLQAIGVKLGDQAIQDLAKAEQILQKKISLESAAADHDWNLTDNERWHQKNDLLTKAIAEQEKYIANLEKIANDKTQPQSVRDRAADASSSAGNTLGGLHSEKAGMGPSPESFADNWAQAMAKVKSEGAITGSSVAKSMGGALSGMTSTLANGLDGILMKTTTIGQGLKNIWSGFVGSMVQAFSQMVAKYAVSKAMMFLVDEAMSAKGLLLSAATAAKSLIMWLPSAIAASISSYGIAAAIGAAAVIAILAGFESGGYTGGTEGAPAGIVHGQEYVFSAPAVRAIGVDNLEAAHRGALAPVAPVAAASSGGGASGGGGTSVSVHMHQDMVSAVAQALKHPSNRRYVADVARGVTREV